MTNKSNQATVKKVWSLLWYRLGSKRTIFIISLFLGLGQTFIMMSFPLIDNLYFNMLEQNKYNFIHLFLTISTIIIFSFLIMIIIGEYLKKTITTQLNLDVSMELANAAQRLPLETVQSTPSSDLVQRVTNDSQRTTNFLTMIADDLANQIIMFILALIYIMWLDWRIGLALLIISPLLVLSSHLLRKKINLIGIHIAEQESIVRQCQQDALQNIELIKAYGIEDWIEERFKKERIKLNKLYMLRFWWEQFVVLTSYTLIDFMVIGTFIVVGWLAIKGTMTIGALIAFSTLIWRLNSPLKNIGSIWTRLQGELGSAGRVFDLLNEEKEPQARSKTEGTSENGVYLNRINFSYKKNASLQKANIQIDSYEENWEEKLLFEELSLDIDPGSFTAIVGPSGSGKSTIAKIAAGLLLPSKGEVIIKGRDSLIDSEWARQNVAYVSQTSFLFSGTIHENLRMVNPKANETFMETATHLALAHDFIQDFPNNYHTELKEQGNSLSGGQKQRLAIARAIMADRPIWIFDELTSALDINSEYRIIDNLAKFARNHNRTIVIIAHRLDTVRNADKIVVVNNGRIIQQGKHEELIKEDYSLYQQMWLKNK